MLCLVEYATYSGLEEIGVEVGIEGLAMFKTLLRGFEKLGININTSISKDIPLFENYPRGIKLEELLESSELALIVAPESQGLLYTLTKLAEKYCGNLGCRSNAVKIAGDKYLTYKQLHNLMPKTEIFKGKTKLDFPLIAKPRDGCSCEGVKLIRNEEELNEIPKGFLLQEYVEGKPCSASFIVGDDINLISIQTQEIKDFKYLGAKIPFSTNLQDLSEIDKIKGLFGYVGVDFIAGDEIKIIEINPRATTPIIAFEEVYGINISELILKNYYKEKIPETTPKKKVFIRKKRDKGNFISFKDYSINLEAIS